MTKTKAQIKAYNKEYFARPEVIARAKIRNAQYRERRRAYKQTVAGKLAEQRYRRTDKCKDRYADARMRYLYGISVEEYEFMVQLQKGKCDICGVKPAKLNVDHCHSTDKVRGLLCRSCNRALGLFKDDKEVLLRAAEYIDAIR